VSLDPLRRWEQRFGALPLPSPLVWAVLMAAFLGFGVLMGRATGRSAAEALASSRAPLKVLVAQGSGAAAAPSSAPTPTPPPASEEATPEPSQAPAESTKSSTPTAPSKTSSTSSTSSKSSSGSKESSGGGEGSSPKAAAKLPAIKHVFVVMLDDEPYATAFGPASPAKYLTGTLEKQGELLLRYYAVAHEGLADGIALLSGQGPTEATAADCSTYSNRCSAMAVCIHPRRRR
jgi:cytoskeletal protein RodZ